MLWDLLSSFLFRARRARELAHGRSQCAAFPASPDRASFQATSTEIYLFAPQTECAILRTPIPLLTAPSLPRSVTASRAVWEQTHYDKHGQDTHSPH